MTLLQMRNKVRLELDIDSYSITDDEIDGKINDAIDAAQSRTHTIYQDYFLSYANIALVDGTQEYDLPADIYSNKIRKLYYNDGSRKYTINRIINLDDTQDVDDNEDYRYLLVRRAGETLSQIQLWPTSNEDSATYVKIWYLRKAATLTLDADEMDMPETEAYVIWHTKYNCIFKDLGNPLIQICKGNMDIEEKNMIETLMKMVPDEDDYIRADTSFYDDFNNGHALD